MEEFEDDEDLYKECGIVEESKNTRLVTFAINEIDDEDNYEES